MKKTNATQYWLVKIMQWSFLHLCIAIIFANVSFATDVAAQELLDRRISIQAVNQKINVVLSEIEKNADVRFSYSPNLIQASRKITLNVANEKLSNVLEKLLSPYGLRYEIVGKQIILQREASKNQSVLPEAPLVLPQNLPIEISVTGIVTDESGTGLPGVSILLKGTQRGTTTDPNGKYKIEVPDKNAILVFSFVGYLPQEVTVGNQSQINVNLNVDTKALEEVVVVGYGTQKKSDLTGSVSSVNAKDFTQGVNNSALQLLNGRAAGVQISQSSSAPGGGTSIRIRGAGSINSSNEALIVIDGLPGATTTSISPEDIESIQILKDASAAAIYGSRAANGVVLITTKKGKSGKPTINYSTYVGVQSVAKKMDLLSAPQYMKVLNDISAESGAAPKFTQAQIDAVGAGTDWQDAIFQNALAQNHQLSFAGGSDNSRYYVGINYLDQNGVVIGSNLKKYNIRLNYEINPLNNLKIALNLNTNRAITKTILTTNSGNENAGPINAALQFDPTISTEKNENGMYNINPLIALENPLALVYGVNQKQLDNRTFGVLSADYTLLKGWTATLRFGGDIQNSRDDSYISRLTQRGLSSGGIGSISSGENLHWLAEFFTSYNKTLAQDHQISAMLGATLEKFDVLSVGASSRGFLSDATLTDLLQSGDADRGDNVSSGRFVNKLNSYLGRLNYTFKEKYLLTASVRTDGTSRFSQQQKYAIFPSFALGWRLSEEPFMKSLDLFSDLKLRASYGQSGNQAISNFETLQTFIAGGRAVFGDGLVQGVEPARIPNPDLRWETTEEVDLGVDFSLLNGRVSGSVEYYRKKTRDQLFNKPLPTTSGFGSIRVNFGEVLNKGFDFTLQTYNLVNKFKWNSTLTLSTLKNEVTELPDFIPQVITGSVGYTANYAIVKVGAPMRAYYGYEVDGIFQTTDQIANSAQPNAKPGHPRFVDLNKDGKIDPNDRTILGSPFPNLMAGLNNNFSYKGFNLNVLLTAVSGIKSLDNNIVESLYPVNFERNRIAAHYLDRWTPSNPNAKYPSGINPSSYGGALAVNSLTVTDASFVRLKNVTLAYDFTLPKKKPFRSVSVYVGADNLWTLTSFQGFDPDANASGTGIERASYNSYPLNRTIRLGANIGF